VLSGGVFESIITVFIRHHACGFTHLFVVVRGVIARVVIILVEPTRQRVSRVASHRVFGSINEVKSPSVGQKVLSLVLHVWSLVQQKDPFCFGFRGPN
jgi:hypothetical protein